MEIVGLGTQILDCPRVRKLIDRHAERFLYQVYTPAEIAFCRDRTHSTEYYAGVWASKEAVLRSLGVKWQKGIAWTDVEIACEPIASPKVALGGQVKALAAAAGATTFKLTFAYTRMYATATAIALK